MGEEAAQRGMKVLSNCVIKALQPKKPSYPVINRASDSFIAIDPGTPLWISPKDIITNADKLWTQIFVKEFCIILSKENNAVERWYLVVSTKVKLTIYVL